MKRIIGLCLILTFLVGLSGCSLPNSSGGTPQIPSLPPVATKAAQVNTLPPLPSATKASATQTQAPGAALATATKAAVTQAPPGATLEAPTKLAATLTQPAPTQPAASATATKPAATATQPAATATKAAVTQAPATATLANAQARIFMIALNDNGASGKKIGCGDSLVPVTITLADPNAPLRGALDKLLAVRTQYYGQSGLYNTLFRSDLHILSVSVQNSVAEIKLGGSLTLGGVCDAPRIQAQLEEVALQFSTVKQANIYVNGIKLQTLLSGK